jgi:hypothetical protein
MEALRAGYLVRYMTIDDIVRELRQAHQLRTLRNKLAHYQRAHILIVDEVASSGWSTPTRTGFSADQPPLHPLLDDHHPTALAAALGSARSAHRRSTSAPLRSWCARAC